MKFPTTLLILLFLTLGNCYFLTAQSQIPEKTDFKNLVITMRQSPSEGWGGGKVSPYIITITGNGTISYEGVDEYSYDVRQAKPIAIKEIPEKIIRKNQLSKKQIKELVSEFYKVDFFSLNDKYISRNNGDGTITIIDDGGLALVTTSITINGKSKSVDNHHFAPSKLIELQRKIYTISNVSRYIKRSPYWLNSFPDNISFKSLKQMNN